MFLVFCKKCTKCQTSILVIMGAEIVRHRESNGTPTSSFTEYSYCVDVGYFSLVCSFLDVFLTASVKRTFRVDKSCWKLCFLWNLKNLNPWLGVQRKSSSEAGSPRQSQSKVVLGPDWVSSIATES
jgi:hypothetical protein